MNAMGARRIYLIAGEASGDLHGANLVRGLRALEPGIELRAWGGDRMSAAGAEVVKHYRELAFMGFTQVLLNLRTILRNLRSCKEDIRNFKPDAIVLIDYPGFNLRIAEFAHELGIPVHYYISPQLWAWKAGRVRIVRKAVDRMYVILPFEQDWYAQHGVEVDFVGHPLLDALAEEAPEHLVLPDEDGRPVVALLPGSRAQEVERMLPAMLEAVDAEPGHRFVIAASTSLPDAFYQRAIGARRITMVRGRTYDLLRRSHAALVTSGTATLETALLGVPQVVCYKGSAINVWLARKLIKVRWISLVNLIAGRQLVRELVQDDMAPAILRKEVRSLLHDAEYRTAIASGYAGLRASLGEPGASARVARAVWKSLPQRP